MKVTAIKRTSLGVVAAVMLAVAGLGLAPVHDAHAQRIKIFKSPDGDTVMICHYTDAGKLLYCDIATPTK